MKFIGFMAYLVLPFFLHKLSASLSQMLGITTEIIAFLLYCIYFIVPYLVVSMFPLLDACIRKVTSIIKVCIFRYCGGRFVFENDPYVVIGVDGSATNEEIKRAFHAIIKKYHPDKVASMNDATKAISMEMTKKANLAFSKIRKERGF